MQHKLEISGLLPGPSKPFKLNQFGVTVEYLPKQKRYTSLDASCARRRLVLLTILTRGRGFYLCFVYLLPLQELSLASHSDAALSLSLSLWTLDFAMSVSRVFLRASRNVLLHCRNSLFQSPQQQHLPHLRNQFHYLHECPTKASVLHEVLPSALVFQRFGISTTTSPQPNEKEAGHEQANAVENEGTSTNVDPAIRDINATSSDPVDEAATGDAKAAEQKFDSDSETDLDDLSKVGLMKLVMEKEETLKMKQREIAAMQDKVLRSYAEMENVMNRTRREAENSKKFAIQGFAKSLLDVADNLSRASSVVKESFVKIDASKDTVGAMPLLKTLLEGVDMTEKQLLEVFKKSGVEKYDPTNEQFDPNRHNAVFQVPDNTKPVGTVAVVLKSGYTLYDRVIRPAEVGVTQAVENSEANQGSSES